MVYPGRRIEEGRKYIAPFGEDFFLRVTRVVCSVYPSNTDGNHAQPGYRSSCRPNVCLCIVKVDSSAITTSRSEGYPRGKPNRTIWAHFSLSCLVFQSQSDTAASPSPRSPPPLYCCNWFCLALPHLVLLFCQNQDLYRAELRRSDTVVSCVGGFGKTDAYMGLVNGEANIKLAEVWCFLV